MAVTSIFPLSHAIFTEVLTTGMKFVAVTAAHEAGEKHLRKLLKKRGIGDLGIKTKKERCNHDEAGSIYP